MNKKNITINFNKRNGKYEIVHNGFSWISDGRKPYITIRKKKRRKICKFFLSFMVSA